MEYEVKNIKTGSVSENEDGTSIITKSVVESGIVGDTYGFTRFDIMDVITLKTLTVDQIQAEIAKAASAMVKEKYPNT